MPTPEDRYQPTLEQINKSTEDMLRRMEEIQKQMNKSEEGFVNLYLETVPRSFIKVTVEDDAKRHESPGPWTFKDHATGKRITVRRAACSARLQVCAGVSVRHEEVL